MPVQEDTSLFWLGQIGEPLRGGFISILLRVERWIRTPSDVAEDGVAKVLDLENRLDEVIAESCRQGLLAFDWLRNGGNGDDGNLRIFGSDLPEKRKAIHVRHHQVEQDQIVRTAAKVLQKEVGAGKSGNRVFSTQKVFKQFQRIN
jgi:hypothetical protein